MPLLLPVLLFTGALAASAPAAAEPVPVHTGLYVLNFGNFDVNKGTYVMDFYLWFQWDGTAAPEGFSPERWELMNGRATSKERLSDATSPDGQREVWYRVQASLYSPPDFQDFPFDHPTLQVLFEDGVLTEGELVYVPSTGADDLLDPMVSVPGYRIAATGFTTETKDYPFGGAYSRGVFEIRTEREVLGTSVKTFLPPLVFMLISGLGFLFPPEKLALRVGAGTSMLLSAVMFHIAQTASLPPLAALTLIDKIMLCTYAFLTLSLASTTLVSVNADYWKRPELTRRITRVGLSATVSAPCVSALLLILL